MPVSPLDLPEKLVWTILLVADKKQPFPASAVDLCTLCKTPLYKLGLLSISSQHCNSPGFLHSQSFGCPLRLELPFIFLLKWPLRADVAGHLKACRKVVRGGGPPNHETKKDHSKIEPALRELSRPVGTSSEAQ